MTSTKKKIRLRKINQQEKDEIFKGYYERRAINKELSPLKQSYSSLKNKNSFILGKTDDTRATQRIESSLAASSPFLDFNGSANRIAE